eukprot:3918789-Amphidinium_carterae.1
MWHKPRADKAATWRASSSPWQGTPTAQSHASEFPRNGANHWDRSWGLRLVIHAVYFCRHSAGVPSGPGV